MYYLLGLSLALAGFWTVNALATVVIAMIWRAISPGVQEWPAQTRAKLVFAIGVIPAICGIVFAGVLVLPSYLLYEPGETGEHLSAGVAALALLSICGMARAIFRGFAAWLATRRLSAFWMRRAIPIILEGFTVPAYSLPLRFPLIAVVGIFTPKLFIASHVFKSLDEGELTAALAHEKAHLTVRDNLKRALLSASRDLLFITPLGSRLERSWSACAEEAADESVAVAGAVRALELASALIKLARMLPSGERPAISIGAFLDGKDGEGLARRVRQLTRLPADSNAFQMHPHKYLRNFNLLLTLCGAICLMVLAGSSFDVIMRVHIVLERAVQLFG